MTITLDHLGIITATNEENAELAAFFADVLGLPVRGDAGQGYAEVQTGGPTIALHRGAMVDGVRPHGGTLLQFRCDDVRAAVEQARSRGADISVEPHETDWGTLSAYLSGPHGVLVELYAWVNR
jgi:predicted enzyme related to lactoylglutathione lyase